MPLPDHLFLSSTDGGLYDTRDPDWPRKPALRPNYSRHHRVIGTVADLKASLRGGAYAWPGGYEIAYLTADGGCLCDGCTRSGFRQIADAIRTNDLRGGLAAVAIVHSGETDAQVNCDHCGRTIFQEDE